MDRFPAAPNRRFPCKSRPLTVDNRVCRDWGRPCAGVRIVSATAHRWRAPCATNSLPAGAATRFPCPSSGSRCDELGLRIEESWELPEDCSGMLVPAERLILLNACEIATGRNDQPLRRFTFTIAHEIGHWECHVRAAGMTEPSFCRAVDCQPRRRP